MPMQDMFGRMRLGTQQVEIDEATLQKIAEDTGGKSYYELWLEALERLLTGKSVLQPAELSERKIAWEEAVARTPHGMPITLESSH